MAHPGPSASIFVPGFDPIWLKLLGSDFGVWDLGFGGFEAFGVWGVEGFGVWGVEAFGVWGVEGFGVRGLGFRAQGLGGLGFRGFTR